MRLFRFCLVALIGVAAGEIFLAYVNQSRIAGDQASIYLFVPAPSQIGRILFTEPVIYVHFFHTFSYFVVALALGASLGFMAALAAFRFQRIDWHLSVAAMAANSFPIVGFYPILVLIFGFDSTVGRVIIGSILAYYPLFVNALYSFKIVTPELVEAARIDGASWGQVFGRIIVPLSASRIVNALRLAVPAAFIGVIVAEWLGARFGVGFLITQSLYQLRPDLVYASFVLVVTTSLVIVACLARVENALRVQE
jgi:ABC-type nitrate/sulfonate/bicarbonate transport system permease component